MKKINSGLLVVMLTSVFLLSACGGGSSSSGAGGGGFVGRYTGVFTLTGTSGSSSFTDSGSVTVLVNADGTVVIDPGTSGAIRGTISGNTFTAALPASRLNEPGLTCTGTVNMTGNGAGNTFNGTIRGNAVCNGVPIAFTGTFSVTRVDSVSELQGTTGTTGVVEEMRRLVGSLSQN